jgi:hypothetical protein
MSTICGPALLYLVFSMTQILIDTFEGLYNTAFIKFVVMIMLTLLLHILCQSGLSVVAWVIVFVPFIFMTVIVSMVLYVFGLNAATGTFNTCSSSTETKEVSNVTVDSTGNIIVYDPYYDAVQRPVYYRYPNIIVPKPETPPQPPSVWSSDPAYQS